MNLQRIIEEILNEYPLDMDAFWRLRRKEESRILRGLTPYLCLKEVGFVVNQITELLGRRAEMRSMFPLDHTAFAPPVKVYGSPEHCEICHKKPQYIFESETVTIYMCENRKRAFISYWIEHVLSHRHDQDIINAILAYDVSPIRLRREPTLRRLP